jgi:hypothetical protein
MVSRRENSKLLALIAKFKQKLLEPFGQVVILGVDTDEAVYTLVGVLPGRVAEKRRSDLMAKLWSRAVISKDRDD